MALVELVKVNEVVAEPASTAEAGVVRAAAAVADPTEVTAEALGVTVQALLDSLRASGVLSE